MTGKKEKAEKEFLEFGVEVPSRENGKRLIFALLKGQVERKKRRVCLFNCCLNAAGGKGARNNSPTIP